MSSFFILNMEFQGLKGLYSTFYSKQLSLFSILYQVPMKNFKHKLKLLVILWCYFIMQIVFLKSADNQKE